MVEQGPEGRGKFEALSLCLLPFSQTSQMWGRGEVLGDIFLHNFPQSPRDVGATLPALQMRKQEQGAGNRAGRGSRDGASSPGWRFVPMSSQVTFISSLL